jgi:hypothetical protein
MRSDSASSRARSRSSTGRRGSDRDAASFTGTLTFTGEPWAWTGWTYDLAMADGSGTIDGSAALTAEGLSADKRFPDASGTVLALIIDDLVVVDASELTHDW